MLLLSLAFAADSFPELQACLDDGQHTQLAMNFCSARHARVSDARRTMAAERISWMGDETLFLGAQEAWRRFREKRCEYLGSFWEGGSGQPMIIHGCTASTNDQRAALLESLLGDGLKPGVAYTEADAALNKAWKAVPKADTGMRDVQRAWLAYRDAECAWEETRRGGTKQLCLAALTVQRTAEVPRDLEH